MGAPGFTHAQPGALPSFATAALGDNAQFKGDGTSARSFWMLWAEALPPSLEITVATKFFQPGQINYQTKPKPGDPKNGWATLSLSPSDFHDEKGGSARELEEEDVDFLLPLGHRRRAEAANGFQKPALGKARVSQRHAGIIPRREKLLRPDARELVAIDPARAVARLAAHIEI